MRHLVLAAALVAVPLVSRAIEEPPYTVVREIGSVEIRRYAAYTVAEVTMNGTAEQAGNAGFRLLAAYIFGSNEGERKLAMTAPVTVRPAPAKLAMTAPVTQTTTADGHLVQFVLPRGTTPATAPVPLDSRIRIREIPATELAAIRYTGSWSDANYRKHLQLLETTLRAQGIAWTGEPIYSRYNSPFSLWFLRRNEIWLALR